MGSNMSRKLNEKDAEICDSLNTILASPKVSKECRIGVATALELILHGKGAYHGFRYLTKNELPEGCRPGINSDADHPLGYLSYEERFKGTDEYRREYFIQRKK